MKSRIYWKKLNPAALSTSCCAQYLKFELNGTVIHEEELNESCMFTRVIQIAASFNRSIYELEIWGGYQMAPHKNKVEESLPRYHQQVELAYTA